MINWRNKGFASAPRFYIARGAELIYRVGGGPISQVLGAYFSPLKVAAVSEAESRFNIVEWGNRCLFVATYRCLTGTAMWIGPVSHGVADIGGRPAEQIYIERPFGKLVLIRDVEALKQDFFVSPKPGRA